MATDARGHTVPTGAENLKRADVLNLSLSTNDPVMAANATERAQKLVDLGSTAARPLLVYQVDVDALYRHNGTAWRKITADYDVRTAVVSIPTNAQGDGSWTFPVAFANSIVNAVAIDAFGTGGALGGTFCRYLPTLSDKTKASFRIYAASNTVLASSSAGVFSVTAYGT